MHHTCASVCVCACERVFHTCVPAGMGLGYSTQPRSQRSASLEAGPEKGQMRHRALPFPPHAPTDSSSHIGRRKNTYWYNSWKTIFNYAYRKKPPQHLLLKISRILPENKEFQLESLLSCPLSSFLCCAAKRRCFTALTPRGCELHTEAFALPWGGLVNTCNVGYSMTV